MSIETDIEAPTESALFKKYPKIESDHHLVEFITDYLRMTTASWNDLIACGHHGMCGVVPRGHALERQREARAAAHAGIAWLGSLQIGGKGRDRFVLLRPPQLDSHVEPLQLDRRAPVRLEDARQPFARVGARPHRQA